MHIIILQLFLIPVAENNGVVHRQCKLQDRGNRIRNKGDGSEKEIGSAIQQHRGNKRYQKDRNLSVGFAGQKQHRNHNHRNQHHDLIDLFLNDLRLLISQSGADIDIIIGQPVLDVVQGLQRPVIRLIIGKCNLVKRRPVVVVLHKISLVRILIGEFHLRNAVHSLDFTLELLRIRERNIGNHHLGRSEGDELLLHHLKTLLRFGGLRKIIRKIIVDLDPIRCDHRENQCDDVNQEKQHPLVHNKGCDPNHCRIAFLLVLFHAFLPCRIPGGAFF